jgi:nitroimidazol reductase NimA-like FMN-containing flavoprotein (pyridoxamine 5'-phosphate oxidase superfamily)
MSSRNYLEEPYHHVRRSDRAVDDENWIRSFLSRAAVGVLATAVDGQPFINSNLFVYDESREAIYIHTAKVGRTRANLEASAPICFSVSAMGRLLPADEALEFSVEYAGVAVFGQGIVVQEEAEKEYGLQRLLDKYCPHLKPGKDYREIIPDELERTSVFRIEIESWSGKRKEVKDDFPGAFWYEEHTPPYFNRNGEA